MTKGKAAILLFFLACMDMSWIYGWAAFTLAASMGSPFPPFEAGAIFALAAVVTGFCTGRGWRMIQVLGLQAVALAAACQETIRAVYFPLDQPLSGAWLLAFFHQSRTQVEWIVLFFVLLWLVLLWIAGAALARRQRGYYAVCARFDVGLGAFFALFLAKFGLEARGGIYVSEHVSGLLVLPFLAASLLAAGTARTGQGSRKPRGEGLRSLGVFIGAGTAALLAFGCVPFLFLPWLTSAAKGGHLALRRATGPLLPLVESVLRFLFMHGTVRPDPPTPALPQAHIWQGLAAGKGSWWMALLCKVLAWGVSGLIAFFSTFVLGALLFFALRWLFSRSPARRPQQKGRTMDPSWIERLRRVLALAARRLMLSIRGSDRAADFFYALVRWGERSGLPRSVSETPKEFGERLRRRFPSLGPQIEAILAAFIGEVYADLRPSADLLVSARSAWRFLQSPFHWGKRLRTRLRRSRVRAEGFGMGECSR